MDITILLGLQEFRNGAGGILTDWCVSKELGTYLMMGWSGNRLINGALKVTVCACRPWIRDARILPCGNSITTATGYSFPSGHTMNGATIFGGGAMRRELPVLLRVVLGVFVCLIAFSRIFLGVHTPQDILVGMAAGLLMMWLTLHLMRWVAAHPGKDLLVACVGVGLGIAVAVYAALKPYPADDNEEGKLIVDGAKMANDTFQDVGYCAAFLVGWVMERRFVQFSTDVSLPQKLTRAAVGLLGYYAVSLILSPAVKAWVPGYAGTLFSCFIPMFYVTFLFPLCAKALEQRQTEIPAA